MADTGRKPYGETAALIPFGAEARLRPPDSLGEPEQAAFTALVTACDPKHFRESDLALLCRWAELTVMCEQARGELAVSGMVSDDGRVSPWFTIHERATKGLTSLARQLKVGPSTRAPRQPKTAVPRASAYETLPRGWK